MSSQIRNLITSFRNAARGVVYCINNERNMRIHLVVACYITVFSSFFNLTQPQFALMLCAIALVIAMEMVNTAVEALVDISSPAYSSLARIAKDIAAGAVLVCAIFAFAIGLLLFFKPATIWHILLVLCTSPLYGGLFVLSAVFALLFIFAGPVKIWRWLAKR
ncbi:diacylglycerol kinase family protein [Hydrogenoanaerobacterium sp.]|uniref:diacylglycerol kinase family protein n=1 Tax=Hydrogenoanaerobacterium sp. TaxID=2953763 RepID=UPI002896972B|nr:diacylglycerol kinase family protein [Hydrogenoanaerobacterium sp.]